MEFPEFARTAAPRWVGHGGLAGDLPQGAPTPATLEKAVLLGVDRLELDVCASSDDELLLLHDDRLPSHRLVGEMTAAQVRAELTSVLTLDEAVDHLRGRVPLLIDIKTRETATPLAHWLAARVLPGTAVCTEMIDAVAQVAAIAPRVERWPSLRDNVRSPRHQSHRWLPLRPRSPREWLSVVKARTGASALCVEHSLVSAELCAVAHALGLQLTAWTVNDALTARRLVACGVDMITTDEVAGMRTAVARRAMRSA